MSRATRRLAEETQSQLLAEEKWLIGTLAKIKKERNCLQIERLHLESLKAKLKLSENTERVVKVNPLVPPLPEAPQVSKPQAPTTSKKSCFNSTKSSENEISNSNEAACNDEVLDLTVNKPVYNNDFNMEEYDEEEEDCDNVVIDMNMLMYGTSGDKKQ